jgi:hypothetical protein
LSGHGIAVLDQAAPQPVESEASDELASIVQQAEGELSHMEIERGHSTWKVLSILRFVQM